MACKSLASSRKSARWQSARIVGKEVIGLDCNGEQGSNAGWGRGN
jgi:hypothetical protein